MRVSFTCFPAPNSSLFFVVVVVDIVVAQMAGASSSWDALWNARPLTSSVIEGTILVDPKTMKCYVNGVVNGKRARVNISDEDLCGAVIGEQVHVKLLLSLHKKEKRKTTTPTLYEGRVIREG